MYYRLNCQIADGTSRGYQWREIDQATFVEIATGTPVLGDAEAQTRDSTEFDPTHTNAPIYYGAVFIDTAWRNDLTEQQAAEAYATTGRERPGA